MVVILREIMYPFVVVTAIILSLTTVNCQHSSPCPNIFQYQTQDAQPGKWVGILYLDTEYALSGIWVKIILDRKVQNLQADLGEISSQDNKEFLIRDGNYNLVPGNALTIPITVVYSPDEPVPSFVSVRINGKTVCPTSKENTPTLTSKCPGVFSYNKDREEEGTWFGTLVLDSEFELKGAWIRIVLDGAAELLINEFGEVRTTDNVQYLITNRNYTFTPGRPLRLPFWVKYAPNTKIPTIQTVRLNGRTICGEIIPQDNKKQIIFVPEILKFILQSSNKEKFPFKIPATATVPPPRVLEPITEENIIIPPTTTTSAPITITLATVTVAKPTSTIATPPKNIATPPTNIATSPSNIATVNTTEEPVDTKDNAYVSCGTVVPQSVNLIIRGETAQSAQWPWHGAIYLTKTKSLDYICGMSLVSEKHALTAAHCVIENISTKKVRDPITMVLYFGLLNRKDFTSSSVQRPTVKSIITHPEYKVSENDIAVIQFERPVKFTNWVRPVCLWEGDTEMRYIVNQTGTVVGFGVTEMGSISDELLFANILVVDTPTCIFSHRDFYSKYTSLNTFCAGNLTQTAVCNGDSGGAMIFKRDGSDVWQVRGIVSTAVRNVDTGLCDYNYYAIFTDAAKYTDWIEKALTT